MSTTAPDLPELMVVDAAQWRAWLGEHHADERGVWLVLANKGTTEPTRLTYDQALDGALCFGWIDGQVRRRDGATHYQRFTPRTRRSGWSARNVEHVTRLIAAGAMQRSGLDAVDAARADGRWAAAYAGPATIEVPDDLRAALAGSPVAARRFDALTSQNRFAVLYRIHGAKRAATRTSRIAEFVAMLERGETPYPQKRPLDP